MNMLLLLSAIAVILLIPVLVITYSLGFIAAVFDIIRLYKKPPAQPYNTWLPDDCHR